MTRVLPEHALQAIRRGDRQRGLNILLQADPGFAADLFASLSADIARLRQNGCCVDCGGGIAPALAQLGSLTCHDCR